jgi:plasmid maintenance system antidote protein VapI
MIQFAVTLSLSSSCLVYSKFYYIFVYHQNTSAMPHQGEIVQEAIKNSGISITRIVEELGITRPTIYRKFKDDTLDAKFVRRIGEIIGHDFSTDFTMPEQSSLPFVSQTPKSVVTSVVTPRVTVSQTADLDASQQLMSLQAKYITLLESYNELLLKVYGPK